MPELPQKRTRNLLGKVFIPRNIIDSDVWKAHPTKLKLYLYFALMANHSDNGIFKKGEHVTSYEKIMKDTGMNRNTISKCIKWLTGKKYIDLIPAKGTRVKVHSITNNT